MSGARAATLLQAEYLRQSFHVDLFSTTAPKDEALASDYRIINIENNKKFKCLSVPTREVLKSAEYSKKVKLLRILYAILVRLGMDTPLYKKLLKRELSAVFNSYDAIIVVSEASKLRHFVSTLKNPKKIQWIHTDYVAWRKHSNWTKKITSHDKKYYKKYDKIVCLSETLRDKFAAFYPSLANKTVAIPNLIDYGTIIKNSLEKSDFEPDKSKLNLITIGRMEEEKRYDSILSLAKDLKECGTDFSWYLVGDGILLEKYKKTCQEMNLSDKVIFTGHLKNVCPLLKECDLFVLLSEYEGTPVTIDEAKVLGIPVLAKNVGGISDQLNGGEFGKALPSISAVDIINFAFDKNGKEGENDFEGYNNQILINLKTILQ
jgi:glycosyltransferase involved in cell wall biosynthesis